MALLYIDSFDHYVTADLAEKWSSSAVTFGTNAISAGNGRHSSASYRTVYSGLGASAAQLVKSLTPGDATAIVGGAVRVDAAPADSGGAAIVSIYDGSTPQVQLLLMSDLKLRVVRGAFSGGTTLGTTAAAALVANTYAYVELKVLIHASAGTVDLKVNGVSVLALTGQNTRNTGTAQWTALRIGHETGATSNSSNEIDFDDLYVPDGSGSSPWNAFLGDCRVDAVYPTAAGNSSGFTPSAGSNYQNVDDTAPDDDSTYNAAASSPLTDTFVVGDAPVAGASIFGVQHCLSMKKTDAGTCTVAPVVRHSSTDYVGSDISPATTYGYGLAINATNPGTSAQWTESDFNAAEFGYKRTA